ncbi:hypothetical protein LDENG_00168330 [Lucifuga dentata]|nr:hypothetical protein LDENG_00168330 [Lucifuga dentata]
MAAKTAAANPSSGASPVLVQNMNAEARLGLTLTTPTWLIEAGVMSSLSFDHITTITSYSPAIFACLVFSSSPGFISLIRFRFGRCH